MLTNIRGALRRMGEMVSAGGKEKRRTVAMPSVLTSLGTRSDALPKPTPVNLRKFAETPVARRAINTVKDRIAGMNWRVQARKGRGILSAEGVPALAKEARTERPRGAPNTSSLTDIEQRIALLTETLEAPNPDDSFRSFAEQVLEDIIVGGFGAAEIVITGDEQKPVTLWPVDGATIRMKSDWDGQPGSARYVQTTGKYGPEGAITLNDDELMYVRLNPRTHTPFGLGRVEVAFETINEFLSAHRYAARLASNTVVQYALWLQDLQPTQHERLIRWWQDEIEGTGKVPILSVEQKPEVLRFGAGTDADLRITWQEFLIRIIADAFDLPAQYLGVERDVNQSTAGQLASDAFQTAIVPTARLLAEHITRDVIGKKLGWTDLEFVFSDLDGENERERAEIDEILIRSGAMTVQEVRARRGLK
jgi:phage portal protein BeeE